MEICGLFRYKFSTLFSTIVQTDVPERDLELRYKRRAPPSNIKLGYALVQQPLLRIKTAELGSAEQADHVQR